MTLKKSKVILTGYRACGKTSTGILLARQLGVDFIDTDSVIQSRANQSIQDMVAEHGWQYFRDLEKELLEELADMDAVVIAAGGGAILHKEAWHNLMKTGLVAWLKADKETICKRLREDTATAGQRPTLTGDDILEEVEKVLAERAPLYGHGSHISIDTSARSPSEIASILVKKLEDQSMKKI